MQQIEMVGLVLTTVKESNRFCVYKHIFPNKKVYIGITCQKPSLRWRSDGSGYKPRSGRRPPKVWNAILKYGWNNVVHEILYDNLSKEEAIEKEIELISLYNSTDDRYGYNISPGGDVPTITSETRQKISFAKRGKNYGKIGENAPMYGKRHSEISRMKISKATKGSNHPMYGRHHTEKTRRHLRDMHKDISKIVIQKDKKGNIINEFSSIHYASKCTGINRQGISFCIKGRYKTAGGFVWEEKI